MRIEPVTLLLWTEPEQVFDVIATLTRDNAVQIKCSIKNVYGAKKVFELTWENDGTNVTKHNICEFERENLSYLTNYTFTVSRLIKLYIYIKYCCIFIV